MSRWRIETKIGGRRLIYADKYIISMEGHLDFYMAKADGTFFQTHSYACGHWLSVEIEN